MYHFGIRTHNLIRENRHMFFYLQGVNSVPLGAYHLAVRLVANIVGCIPRQVSSWPIEFFYYHARGPDFRAVTSSRSSPRPHSLEMMVRASLAFLSLPPPV